MFKQSRETPWSRPGLRGTLCSSHTLTCSTDQWRTTLVWSERDVGVLASPSSSRSSCDSSSSSDCKGSRAPDIPARVHDHYCNDKPRCLPHRGLESTSTRQIKSWKKSMTHQIVEFKGFSCFKLMKRAMTELTCHEELCGLIETISSPRSTSKNLDETREIS